MRLESIGVPPHLQRTATGGGGLEAPPDIVEAHPLPAGRAAEEIERTGGAPQPEPEIDI